MPQSVRVVPAILTDSPTDLARMVRQAETFTGYVQFDIMDGRFVPSRSISAEDLARISIKFEWEAHLMVYDPETYLAGFQRAGAQRIVFHYEAVKSPFDTINRIRDLGLKAGIAINPETPAAVVLPLAIGLDSVLLMSVHPGFYGAKFIPEVLDKVAELRGMGIEIGIDGGVKEENIVTVARSGLDVICVGSAVFHRPDPAKSYRRLQELASAV